jgi:transcription initiation factor TFIIIB Brf1 subunit/transcription initiation factor TFIIB
MIDATTADLLDRTEKVEITTDDGTKWVVHIRAGPEDRAGGVKTFKFSARELNASSPSVFTEAYLGRFLTKLDLDAEEWRKITSEWIDSAEPPEDSDD